MSILLGVAPPTATASKRQSYSAVTCPYTTTVNDQNLSISGTSGTITVHTAVGNTGQILNIVHQGASLSQVYTFVTTSGQTIGGIASGVYNFYTFGESFTLISDGANWLIEGHYAQTAEVNSGTLAITGSTSNPTKGTLARDDFWWKRIGDECLFRYEYKQTAATGGTAASGDYQIAWPTGISVDVTKVLVNTGVFGAADATGGVTILGTGQGNMAAVDSHLIAYALNTSQFKIWSPTGNGVWSSGFAALNAATIQVFVSGKFPVTGWQP